MSSTMTSELRYFFDTYAIIEIVRENKNYERFKDADIISGLLNYGELYSWTLKGKGDYRELLTRVRRLILHLDIGDIIEGMKFKYQNRDKKLSFVDCVGYAMAKRRGLRFVTGDDGFRNLPGVEFVKQSSFDAQDIMAMIHEVFC